MTAGTANLVWTPFAALSRFVSLPGGRRVQIFERGNGPPLLYLHGFGFQTGWNATLERLATSFRVVAPLFAGFGESTGGEDVDDVLDAVLYWNDVLDALSLDHVDVVGFDLGGMFAAEVAAVTPTRIRRLVLVAPFGLWDDADPVTDVFGVPLGELPRYLFTDPESPAARTFLGTPEEPERALEVTVQRTRALAASTKYLWAVPDRGLRKRLHRIKAETLIVWGEDDRLVPISYAERFRAAIAQARVIQLDGGHMLLDERSEAVATAILSFLARG